MKDTNKKNNLAASVKRIAKSWNGKTRTTDGGWILDFCAAAYHFEEIAAAAVVELQELRGVRSVIRHKGLVLVCAN